MKKLLIPLMVLLAGCSSAKLVENYKNPDIVLFHAYKVLVVGMTRNETVRKDYETRLKEEFEERGIEAMRSLDVFDINFTDSKKNGRRT